MFSRFTSRPRRALAAGLTAVAASAALVFASAPAQAQEELILVQYDVNGSTHIAGTNSDITLGPTTIDTAVDEFGNFTGTMVLPGTRTEFKLAGFIPVTADVNFEPVGDTTGSIKVANVRFRTLETESQYYVRLSNIKAVGLPLFTGSNCRTSSPVVVPANTPEGEYFNIARGGNLTGEYSIGNFQNCGLIGGQTLLINALIPGGGNTIDLQLTNGRPLN
ncbi:hypothetical protein [Aeromicrobium piscarium]|uniref:Carboxypeptidase regulatory-like domain-containing protein n=1 Tax=Aeromicrobium piscarium TaxID=2590901 RepID=A0A554RX72_9ACTN|nr:hypothetical protein [Aeromicrobium piscarium]TSD58680.1 hypothetical protein FNM00_13555 [Aeromicrobium piscarium]